MVFHESFILARYGLTLWVWRSGCGTLLPPVHPPPNTHALWVWPPLPIPLPTLRSSVAIADFLDLFEVSKDPAEHDWWSCSFILTRCRGCYRPGTAASVTDSLV